MSELDEMKRPDLMKRAKELGIPGKGSNEELIEAIKESTEGSPESTVEAPPAEPDVAAPDLDNEGEGATAGDEADAVDAEETPVVAEVATGEEVARKPITRTNDRGDWWCPFSDHSQRFDVDVCPVSGARREGDEAVIYG